MGNVKKRFCFTIKIAGSKQPRGVQTFAFDYAEALQNIKKMHPNCIIIDSY